MQFKKLMGNNEKTFTIPDALQLLAKKKKNLSWKKKKRDLIRCFLFFLEKKKCWNKLGLLCAILR